VYTRLNTALLGRPTEYYVSVHLTVKVAIKQFPKCSVLMNSVGNDQKIFLMKSDDGYSLE
jgi:hypothetical protein